MAPDLDAVFPEVFWATGPVGNTIARRSVYGSAPVTVLASTGMPMAVRVHDDWVYFGAADGVHRVPKDLGSPAALLVSETPSSSGLGVVGLAVDADGVYWLTTDENPAVRMAHHDGSNARTLAVPTSAPLGPVVADDVSVFWTEGGRILRVAK